MRKLILFLHLCRKPTFDYFGNNRVNEKTYIRNNTDNEPDTDQDGIAPAQYAAIAASTSGSSPTAGTVENVTSG